MKKYAKMPKSINCIHSSRLCSERLTCKILFNLQKETYDINIIITIFQRRNTSHGVAK